MPAGDYTAGDGVAGADPVYVSAPAPRAVAPAALLYDLGSRRFRQNTDGSLVGVHPVDSQVEQLLGIEAGAIASNSTFGQRLRALLARCAPNRITQTVNAEVRRVLGALLSNGDIKLVSIAVDASRRGRTLIAVTYVNLRDPATNLANPALNQRTLLAKVA